MKRHRDHVLVVVVMLLPVVGCSASDSKTTDAGADKGAVEDTTTDEDTSANTVTPDAVTPDVGGDTATAFQLSCGTVQFCLSCCPSEDDTCKDACSDNMTAAAKKAWEELNACATTKCVDCHDQECTTCVEQKCSTEKTACNYGDQGSVNCADTFGCLGDCPQMTFDSSGTAQSCPADPGIVCFQGCMQAATAPAAKLAYDLGFCRYSECSATCFTSGKEAECDACLADNCTEAKNTCDNDS